MLWDLLRDPKFKSAYYRALGPKVNEKWLASLDGPSREVREIRVDDVDYLLGSSCKAHWCNTSQIVLLYSAARGIVYAKIVEEGKTILIGVPSSAVAAELDRLHTTEFGPER